MALLGKGNQEKSELWQSLSNNSNNKDTKPKDAWGTLQAKDEKITSDLGTTVEDVAVESKRESPPASQPNKRTLLSSRDEEPGSAIDSAPSNVKTTKWDEYGGRNKVNVSEQAKERARIRLQQKEERLQQQKERARQRLEQLEKKRAGICDGNKAADARGTEASTTPKMLFDPKSGNMVKVDTTSKVAKKKKMRSQKREEKMATAATTPVPELPEVLATSTEASPSAKASRLPRTCGVLYAVDASKGSSSYCCVDECAPDFGYGMHSVPGGRIRNPDAYQELVEHFQEGGMYYEQYDQAYELDTEEETLQKPVWVSADDKMELLHDDSPTLKPTAKEWAPSQAALAAVARKMPDSPLATATEGVSQPVEDDSHEELDFDPTKALDWSKEEDKEVDDVMEGIEEDTDPVDLSSMGFNDFRLDASAFASNTSTNLFAFGASSTWGQASGNNDVDWGRPLSSTANADAARASFLSGGAWAGLGGPGTSG